MPFKPEHTSYTFKQSEIIDGSLFHAQKGTGYEMDISGYLQLLQQVTANDELQERHLPEISPHSDGIDALLKTLAICLPVELRNYNRTLEQQDLYAELNEIVNDQFQTARQLLDERLAELNISERELPSIELDDQTQTAISQVQEHAWYLVLLNHRVIYSATRAHAQWSNLDPIEQQDLLQLTLMSCWRSACRHKPEHGAFLTYLGSYLPDHIGELAAAVQGISKNHKVNYLDSYKHARVQLRGTVLDYPYWHELYACMVFDKKAGRLSYQEPLRAILAYERIYRGNRPIHDDNDVLRWHNSLQNMRETLDFSRLPRLRQILDLAYPLSLDRERLIYFFNERGDLDSLHGDIYYRLSTEEEDIPDLVDQRLLEDQVLKVFEYLDAREVLVLQLRYGLHGMGEHTLDEVGEIIGRTYERARQIESSALRKLRHPSRSYLIEDFRSE